MTTQQIADRLVELCRKNDYETAQQELYARDAISIEPSATPGFEKETRGLQAIIEKGHKFSEMIEANHSTTISDPLVTDGSIAFTLDMDVTMKEGGRSDLKELCVYQVKNGKIISEQFFM